MNVIQNFGDTVRLLTMIFRLAVNRLYILLGLQQYSQCTVS
jgi:hypothetical protein